MKTRRMLYCYALLAAALAGLPGCASSIAHRIQEKAAEFGKLDAGTQQHLRDGAVEIGYNKDMVYVALGRATEETTDEWGHAIWIYKNMMLPTKEGFRGLTFDADKAASAGGTSAHGASSRGVPNLQLERELAAASQLSDLPVGTLTVYFFMGRVFKMTMTP